MTLGVFGVLGGGLGAILPPRERQDRKSEPRLVRWTPSLPQNCPKIEAKMVQNLSKSDSEISLEFDIVFCFSDLGCDFE